ncbi:MAG: tetratricopeptide repeat protein [Acidimicrobiia bacterium]|nr:tetratricopeptide repeat protein [Acidimicrobiia bacterium]
MKATVGVVGAAVLLTVSCAQRSRQARRAPTPTTAVASMMNRQIVNAIDAGEGDIELRQLRARMAADPENPAIRIELAESYQAKGFPEVALEHYRLAVARFPDNAELQLRLVRALRGQGLRREATQSAGRFLNAHANHAEMHAWAGIIQDELGDWQSGEKHHRQAVGHSTPPKASLHNNLGHNLLMQKRAGEAAAEFRKALELEPRNEVARNNLGLALAADPQQAVLQWQSQSDPATAHSNMAAVLIEQRQYQEARRELKIALGYKPDHPAALRNLALVAELDGKPAVIEREPPKTFWGRVAATMEKVFLTPEGSAPSRQ